MTQSHSVKAVIFDCFGVVINYGFQQVYESLGGSEDDREFLHDTFVAYNRGYMDDHEFLIHVAQHFSVEPEEVKNRFARVELQNPAITQLITDLRARYKTALLTNIGLGGVDRYFTKEEQRRFFDTIVVSGEVGLVKPDPEIYRLTADRLHLTPEQCIFIDDGEPNCAGARRAGMQAICFKNFTNLLTKLKELGVTPESAG